MRRILLVTAGALALLVGSIALAQRVTEFRSSGVRLNLVELRPLADGGVSLSVHAEVQAADGGNVSISREQTCEPGNLTAAQRTALVTIRSGALSCWSSAEGL
jgi:hypothetical protein